MKRLSILVFTLAFLGWAWLEFVASDPQDGVQDILFWLGMGALLVNGWDSNRKRSTP